MNAQYEVWGKSRSVIREIFEYARKRREEIGADKVFDFSLGNPSVPTPKAVQEAYLELLQTESDLSLHGYTSAQGDGEARQAIAQDLNRRFGTVYQADHLYLTCGAAAAVRIALGALLTPGQEEEVLTFAPFFPEYRVFTEAAGGKLVLSPTKADSFQIDFTEAAKQLTPRTKAVLLNSPNNPSGVVYPEADIQRLADLLQEREAAYGHPIYLVTDEPYRELVYDPKTVVPFVPKYYANTLVCYSYSKSLSLPGERIGYILIPDAVAEASKIYATVCGAGRALGYVCAPSLAQHVLARCPSAVADLTVYRKNRDLLYQALTSYGFSCVYPDGAFYLFVRSPEESAEAFCQKAREWELLLVPADSFGTPGYVRMAYCVPTEQIEKSLPAFQKLAKAYDGRLA